MKGLNHMADDVRGRVVRLLSIPYRRNSPDKNFLIKCRNRPADYVFTKKDIAFLDAIEERHAEALSWKPRGESILPDTVSGISVYYVNDTKELPNYSMCFLNDKDLGMEEFVSRSLIEMVNITGLKPSAGYVLRGTTIWFQFNPHVT